MLGQYADTSVVETPRYLRLEDFEREGVRVAERRYSAKDTIFVPGDPDGQLYFLLRERCACTGSTADIRRPQSRC